MSLALNRTPLISLALILIGALFLRVWQIDSAPPGWRDDELINSLVISQHVLDGDVQVYYADASGHEGLYHILNALPLAIWGATPAGIRGLSIVMGMWTILFTFLLGREMTRRPTLGLIAAAAMGVSFWSLMYSRIGLRHISLLFCVLPAFYWLWRGLSLNRASERTLWRPYIISGVWLGLAYYTYFASRGVPLILIAWLVYLLVWNRPTFRKAWPAVWISFGVSLLMAIPLVVTLRNQPEAESRVAELAIPIVEAQRGNFEPLFSYTYRTISMFHAFGDTEFLYNIPNRPVFGPITAVIFWLGVAIALVWTFRPVWESDRPSGMPSPFPFLLLWWFAGIAPAFISVPPASLSHTILAQPAVYLLLAAPLAWLAAREWLPDWGVIGLALLLTGLVAARDIPDYFVEWNFRGNTRFLYRADIRELAELMRDREGAVDIGLSSVQTGPWDRIAFEANLRESAERVDARLYDPGRVMLIEPAESWLGVPVTAKPFVEESFVPQDRQAGGLRQHLFNEGTLPFEADSACFENGLCVDFTFGENGAGGFVVDVLVDVDRPLALPEIPLISNPPPPGVYAGPRLMMFVHARAAEGSFITGDDAFGIDPQTLEVGDRFWQRHQLFPPAEAEPATIAIGFYDPMTGQRILVESGEDGLVKPINR